MEISGNPRVVVTGYEDGYNDFEIEVKKLEKDEKRQNYNGLYFDPNRFQPENKKQGTKMITLKRKYPD